MRLRFREKYSEILVCNTMGQNIRPTDEDMCFHRKRVVDILDARERHVAFAGVTVEGDPKKPAGGLWRATLRERSGFTTVQGEQGGADELRV